MTTDRAGALPAHPSLGEMTRVFARIGCLSFGGPAGQIALMHRELVDDRQWISDARFLHALNFCMLLPGPEAQQLATYIGWLLHGTRGGLIAGILFVIPGFLVITALSTAYMLWHGTGALDGLFFGLKAAVLAVVAEALIRVGRRALKTRLHGAIAAAAFVAIYALHVPFPVIVLAAGLLGLMMADRQKAGAKATVPDTPDSSVVGRIERVARPTAVKSLATALVFLAAWAAPVLVLAATFGADAVFMPIGVFFSKMAVVTFGGAYAVLAYVAQQAVEQFAWLRPGEMVDGLALAETTPGPLVLVLTFVGYVAAFRSPGVLDPTTAGLIGAALTTWVTFVPCFLWIFLGAPYVEVLRGNVRLAGALQAITAAVVGIILNLALWFGLHVLFREVGEWEIGPIRPAVPVAGSLDPIALALAIAAAIALLRFKIGMAPTLLAAALAGLALSWFGLTG